MCFVSAAYVVVHAVDAGVSYTLPFIEGYAAKYRSGYSTWGDSMGVFELVALILYMAWSMLMTVLALVEGANIWQTLEARERGVKEDGAGGVALDDLQALKLVVLCIIMGVMSIVGGFSLGDVADELITWFDHYAENGRTKQEYTNPDGQQDPDGTAAQYDIIYHYVTLLFGYVVFTAITVGGYIFGLSLLRFNDEFTCDFDAVSDELKAEIGAVFATMDSVEKCYEVLPAAMLKLDVNKNGIIDRCEDATMLNYFGNTEEYAKKYSHSAPLSAAARRCE